MKSIMLIWSKLIVLIALAIGIAFSLSSCAAGGGKGGPSESVIKETLSKNPDLIFDVIRDNPEKFFRVIEEAQAKARESMQHKSQKKEAEELEEAFKNPKKPTIASDRAVFGSKSAPITIVEYSDFLCPYCGKAAKTMEKVLKNYKGKVRLIYKHLPFKPLAEPTARYFEAIAMQSSAKARKFHDYIYENQGKLHSQGESFLNEAAKKAGADISLIKKNKDSKKVTERLASDKTEAQKFDFSGTPGFLVNGVPVRGAYPYDYFKKIIDRHLL